jgi:hypothetical protein
MIVRIPTSRSTVDISIPNRLRSLHHHAHHTHGCNQVPVRNNHLTQQGARVRSLRAEYTKYSCCECLGLVLQRAAPERSAGLIAQNMLICSRSSSSGIGGNEWLNYWPSFPISFHFTLTIFDMIRRSYLWPQPPHPRLAESRQSSDEQTRGKNKQGQEIESLFGSSRWLTDP